MGFFRALAYVAGGVGAVILAPVTGGSSIALAIGALGTTTAAGAAIGAGIGATAAAIDHAATAKDEARRDGVREGIKAGEMLAQRKYEQKIADLTERLRSYHNLDQTILALYAVGLAVANADGEICADEREELDQFVVGCLTGNLPPQVKGAITKLSNKPPTLERAIKYAVNANLSRRDIQDVVDVVAMADGEVSAYEKDFSAKWMKLANELALV